MNFISSEVEVIHLCDIALLYMLQHNLVSMTATWSVIYPCLLQIKIEDGSRG